MKPIFHNLKWSQVMPTYIDCLKNGNDNVKQLAEEELLRLAELVDELNSK